ncbi:YjbQ family protein [Rhodobacteraceae bacterium]|nr:YjbQ family protein [Paracoccaceae bacterium]
MASTTFEVTTKGPGLYEITRDVRRWAEGAGEQEALVTLFIRHTSASLVIQENADPDVQVDLKGFFDRLVPPSSDPRHDWMIHTYEGPDDMPAHVKSALLPVSLQIPLVNGGLVLGTWQGIYLFEHRKHSHRREVVGLLR